MLDMALSKFSAPATYYDAEDDCGRPFLVLKSGYRFANRDAGRAGPWLPPNERSDKALESEVSAVIGNGFKDESHKPLFWQACRASIGARARAGSRWICSSRERNCFPRSATGRAT